MWFGWSFLCLPYASRLLEMFVNNSAACSARSAVVFRDCQFSRNLVPCWLSRFPDNSGNQGNRLADSAELIRFPMEWLNFNPFVHFIPPFNFIEFMWFGWNFFCLPFVSQLLEMFVNNSASGSARSAVVFRDCRFPWPCVLDFSLGTSFLADFRVFQIIQGIKTIG
jgi:hypothetical protein